MARRQFSWQWLGPWFLAGTGWAALMPAVAAARQDVLAITGDASPSGGGVLATVTAGSINDGGQVAFRATLAAGVGGVTATNDQAVWRIGDGVRTVLAREGSGGVPGVAGASFDVFSAASMLDNGSAAVRGTMQLGGGVTATSNQGLWRLTPGGGSLGYCPSFVRV